MGWSKIVLESDSTYVVSLLRGDSTVPYRYRFIWTWMKELLVDIDLTVVHVYREGNSVADAISTFGDFEDFI